MIDMLAIGETWKTAADRLEISPRTVEFHCRNLLRKIGAQTTAQAVAKMLSL